MKAISFTVFFAFNSSFFLFFSRFGDSKNPISNNQFQIIKYARVLRLRGFNLLCYLSKIFWSIMNIINASHPNPGRREKIKLNFYFHTSLWCPKRFYEGLKGLHKTFFRHHKEMWKQKFSLILISIQFSEMHETGKVKIFSVTKQLLTV